MLSISIQFLPIRLIHSPHSKKATLLKIKYSEIMFKVDEKEAIDRAYEL